MIAWWWIPLSYFILVGVFVTFIVVGGAVHQFRARRKFDRDLEKVANETPREQM